MRSQFGRAAALVATGALVLASAACGDSDTAGSDTVNVGVVGTFAGPAAASETMPEVAEAWEKSTNAAGGINGQKVNLILKDVGTNPGASITAVRSLINDDDVVAIIDLDFNDISWVELAESAGVAVIGASGGFGAFASTNVYPVLPNAATISYSIPATAKEFGDELAIGYASEIAALAQQVALVKEFAKGIGVDIPVALKMSSSQPDYTAFCQLVKNSGVDSYFLSFVPAVAQNITHQCSQQGVEAPQVLAASLGQDSWVDDPAYDGAAAVSFFAPFFDTSVPGIKEYNDALKEYAPDLVGVWKGAGGNLSLWAAAEMFAAAASHADGNITADSVLKGLGTMKGETLDGLISPVDYTGQTPKGPSCWYVWYIKDGALSLPPGAEWTCAPESAIAPVEDMLAKSVG